MAIDAEKLTKIRQAVSELGETNVSAEDIEWVFNNYEVDPDKVAAAFDTVLDFMQCYATLEEMEDERAHEEWRQRQAEKLE